jgi:hypothetical protein
MANTLTLSAPLFLEALKLRVAPSVQYRHPGEYLARPNGHCVQVFDRWVIARAEVLRCNLHNKSL